MRRYVSAKICLLCPEFTVFWTHFASVQKSVSFVQTLLYFGLTLHRSIFYRYPAAAKQPRDENTKMRTRIVARAALFSSFSDDLRRVIGSETSRSGMTMLFDMLQHPVLNKRLGIVILEGILETLFHEQDFKTIFQKLHSRSSRVRNELKNSQRKHSDLRR